MGSFFIFRHLLSSYIQPGFIYYRIQIRFVAIAYSDLHPILGKNQYTSNVESGSTKKEIKLSIGWNSYKAFQILEKWAVEHHLN